MGWPSIFVKRLGSVKHSKRDRPGLSRCFLGGEKNVAFGTVRKSGLRLLFAQKPSYLLHIGVFGICLLTYTRFRLLRGTLPFARIYLRYPPFHRQRPGRGCSVPCIVRQKSPSFSRYS